MKNDKLSYFEDFNHASHLKNKEKELCLSPNAEEFKIKTIFVEKSIIRSEYKILNSSKKILKKPPQMFYKKGFLKHFTIFTEKHLCWPASLQLYLKETPTQVFSSEYYEIVKNIYFEEHLRTATLEDLKNIL